jgi:carotenoid cleavage dioxygenase-like enzyme
MPFCFIFFTITALTAAHSMHFIDASLAYKTSLHKVVITKKKLIVLDSPTVQDPVHDYYAFTNITMGNKLPNKISIYTYTGSLGIHKDYPNPRIVIPKKSQREVCFRKAKTKKIGLYPENALKRKMQYAELKDWELCVHLFEIIKLTSMIP